MARPSPQLGGKPAVLLRERVYDTAVSDSLPEFVALGQPGNDHYAGLETFANPGVAQSS